MVTTQDIIDLGWKHVMTSSNGGTKGFQRGKELFVIEGSADNFIYKRDNDPRISEIVIKTVDKNTHKFIDLYTGSPETKQELSELIEQYCK